ncbi:MAG: ADP-forming succinate--CoA ligase subunit beta [Caldilineales bacterium]
MNLHEYQSKRVFAQYGIPIPRGEVANSPAEAREIAAKLGGKVVVKSQVLVGGRGKAGGIKLAVDKDDAEEKAKAILGMTIKGLTVTKVLVDEAADIKDEIYLGLVIDRAQRRVIMMGSSEGGVDIEEVAANTPEKIIKVAIDPCIGFRSYQATDLATALGIPKDLSRSFAQIASGLYNAFVGSDASLAEINPLVVTGDGKLLAVDGKMSVDDNALYRQKGLSDLRDPSEEDPYEVEARRFGLSYVKLDGTIGCMVNGAGLSMATMDMIKLYGGEPANFLDIGGGATAERVAAALRIILSDTNVTGVLINIFGGITRCDEVARGVVQALDEVGVTVPMVVRLVGTNEEEGRAILADAKMETASTLAEAASKAVAVSR